MDKLLRNLIIALAILIVVVPIGLLAVGTAYGEWSIEDLQGLVGFIPAGLASIAGLWSAPLPDYALPSSGESFLALSISYWLSAVIGVILCVGAIILIGRLLTRRRAIEKQ